MRTGQGRHRPKRFRLNRELVFAHRLGLRLGIDDPEQWLEECPREVFDNWYAAYRVEPFGGERELLARMVSLLYLIACREREPDAIFAASDKLMQWLMPSDWVDAKKPERSETPDSIKSAEEILARAFG